MQPGQKVTVGNRESIYYLCSGKVLKVAPQGPVPILVALEKFNKKIKDAVTTTSMQIPFRPDELFLDQVGSF